MRPEARIRKNIKDLMKMLGYSVWDLEQNRKTRQTPGIPDLIISGNGSHIHVEVKVPGKKETLSQVLFRETCNANGGTSLVWYSDSDAMDWCHSAGVVKLQRMVVRSTTQEDR